MAKFAVKALAVAALVCFVFDLATCEDYQQAVVDAVAGNAPAPEATTAHPATFKDKLKGFVSSVKEGAVDAYESVSDSVSDAAHKVDEKRKEVVAGTKKLVSGAIEKIKNSYKQDDSAETEVPRTPEQVKEALEKAAQNPIKLN